MAGGGVESRGVLTFLASKLRPINCEPWVGRRQADVPTFCQETEKSGIARKRKSENLNCFVLLANVVSA